MRRSIHENAVIETLASPAMRGLVTLESYELHQARS
jgi:hypothetical protein